MEEKKVELTDEETAEEIIKALKNTKKTLEDLQEDDDDYDKLSLVKKINNSSLWLIKRLLEVNGKKKAEIERLNKCVMSEEQVRKCCADIIQETRQQAVKDTAQEALEAFICQLVNARLVSTKDDLYVEMLEAKDDLLKEKYGVEVE